MRSGATSRVGCPRWKVVPTTASSPTWSRTRWAISSRPTESGMVTSAGLPAPRYRRDSRPPASRNRSRSRDLLGSLCLIALAPADRGVAGDLLLELDDPVHQRLRPRGAARHVDVRR